jgi:predicted aconitase with swiveling domain
MNVPRVFDCKPIAYGKAEGPALVSGEAICFYLVEPDTGKMIERGHDLENRSLAGTVLVVPSGKGSSVVQMDGLFKIVRKGKGPAALVVRDPDPVLASALLIMEIPSAFDADPAFFEEVRGGDRIELDADAGRILLYRE